MLLGIFRPEVAEIILHQLVPGDSLLREHKNDTQTEHTEERKKNQMEETVLVVAITTARLRRAVVVADAR